MEIKAEDEVEILLPSGRTNAEINSMNIQESDRTLTKKFHPGKIIMRIVLVVMGTVLYKFGQRWIQMIHEGECNAVYTDSSYTDPIFDLILNNLFTVSNKTADIMLILSSLYFDVLTIMGCLIGIFSKSNNNFRVIVEMLCEMVIRFIMEVMICMPLPKHYYFQYPGFPSLFVTYRVTTDLFFSGHASHLTIVSNAMRRYIKSKKMSKNKWFMFVLILLLFFMEFLVLFTVLVLRFHRTSDVYTGIVTALWIISISQHLAIKIDASLNYVLLQIHC
eukprot:37040_1